MLFVSGLDAILGIPVPNGTNLRQEAKKISVEIQTRNQDSEVGAALQANAVVPALEIRQLGGPDLVVIDDATLGTIVVDDQDVPVEDATLGDKAGTHVILIAIAEITLLKAVRKMQAESQLRDVLGETPVILEPTEHRNHQNTRVVGRIRHDSSSSFHGLLPA